MNYEKLKTILKVIKDSDELPRDRWGCVLGHEELSVWFELDKILEPNELKYMKARLAELSETQNAIDMMKLPQF